MLIVGMSVLMAMAAISAAFRLEGGPHVCKIRAKTTEHLFYNVVGPESENLVSDFSRQMPISEMPGKAYKLIGILVACFDYALRSGLDLEPPSVVQLQAVSIGHCNRLWKLEKDVFAVISGQANAAAMARVEV
jgi:hypothetical protein